MSKLLLWQGYSSSDTDEQVLQSFIELYERNPAKIVRTNGAVLAGPITQEEHDDKAKPKITS